MFSSIKDKILGTKSIVTGEDVVPEEAVDSNIALMMEVFDSKVESDSDDIVSYQTDDMKEALVQWDHASDMLVIRGDALSGKDASVVAAAIDEFITSVDRIDASVEDWQKPGVVNILMILFYTSPR